MQVLKRYIMAVLVGGGLMVVYLLTKTKSLDIRRVHKDVEVIPEDVNISQKGDSSEQYYSGPDYSQYSRTENSALIDGYPTSDYKQYNKTQPRLIGSLFNMPYNNRSKQRFRENPNWKFFFTYRQNPNWKNSTCSTSLQKKAFTTKEFGPIFRPDIQMLMNSRLFNVKEYWRLKPWTIPFGYQYRDQNITYEEVRDTLKLFPAEDSILNFSRGGKPECITCAVVGNGGILNGSGMGKEIDMHDYIFRVNQAYLKGYEDDVGNKTTHYVFFDRSLRPMEPDNYPVSQNITYIFVPCRKADYSYLRKIGDGTNKFKAPPENVRVIHPDFMRYIHFVWMRVHSFRPTTGGIMAMVALHTCDKLSLYGLGYNTNYSNHYFDKEYHKFTAVLGSHDHRREIKLWDSLDKEGIVYWYRRDIF